jgi:hypothetical protein
VRSRVIDRGDVPADRAVEVTERELRRVNGRAGAVGRQVAGQRGQQFGGDGAEEPLDLAAALRDAGRGEPQSQVQVGGDLFEVAGW